MAKFELRRRFADGKGAATIGTYELPADAELAYKHSLKLGYDVYVVEMCAVIIYSKQPFATEGGIDQYIDRS